MPTHSLLKPPDAPTERATALPFSWAAVLAPMAFGAVMAAVLGPRFALFALMGPIIVGASWWEGRRRNRRDRRRGGRRFRRQLEGLAAQLALANAQAAAECRAALPDAAEVCRRAQARCPTVWERRPDHPDFLRLVVGTGSVAWQPELSAEGANPEVEAALQERGLLERVPICADIGHGGVIGVAGPVDEARAVARWLTLQATVHHGPADLLVVPFLSEAAEGAWAWLGWLPHMVAADRLPPQRDGTRVLAVVDGPTTSSDSAAGEQLASAHSSGVVVAPTVDRLPACCTTVVELADRVGAATLHHPSSGTSSSGILATGLAFDTTARTARSLAALHDPESAGGGELPEAVSLLDLLGVDRPTPDWVRDRWDRCRAAQGLAAVVGLDGSGRFELDLAGDGPHALVAGTTGAGKSELLRTWVVSMAVTVPPDALNLVLIDYKGGSTFDACAELPHSVGVVTDLDERLGERALRCLEAELRSRERTLREAGAADLASYQRSEDPVRRPIPRLVVVIDEFATLVAELPTFMSSLVGIAQRGRSLGVHLVLATQRPGGAVTDDIRANTNLRVCLRVVDAADSRDVVGDATAAGLAARSPGRAVARTGTSSVEVFHAASVSSRHRTRRLIEVAGGAPTHRDHPGTCPTHDRTDLERLVDAAREAASTAGLPVAVPPWPDPLPTALDKAELPEVGDDSVPLGLADDPDHQRHRVFSWAPGEGALLVLGAPSSGVGDVLARVGMAIAGRWSADDAHLYVLHGGSQALDCLSALPHVGSCIEISDRERRHRLIGHLTAELAARRAGPRSHRVFLLIENVAALGDALDDLDDLRASDDLVRVVADGAPFGIHVAIGVQRPAAVPSGIVGAVGQRLALRLADDHDYGDLGLRPPAPGSMPPGRGVDVGRDLEVQIAGMHQPAESGVASLTEACAEPANAPALIEALPDRVARADLVGHRRLHRRPWFVPVGVDDRELRPSGLRLGEGDHVLVTGPARSGKTTLLATIADQLRDTPGIVVVALSPRGPLEAPVDVVAGTASELVDVLSGVDAGVALVDDAHLVDDPGGALTALIDRADPALHIVVAARNDRLRAAWGHWARELGRLGRGIALRPDIDLDGELWGVDLPRSASTILPGRGVLVDDGALAVIQVAS